MRNHAIRRGMGFTILCVLFPILCGVMPALASPKESNIPTKSNHWAYRPPVKTAIPKVRQTQWVRNPIDAFVLARLEQAKIKPPVNADRRTLLRRAYLDVTGLPPTPAEQQRFLADTAPNAYERLVEELLARPQYGERWGRHWLDTVRYAESNGYERDGTKPSAWRYRDYVVQSFNADKPYDRFITEQIAGDELPETNAETQIATTFMRLGVWDDEPPDAEMDRFDQLDDVLGTTATAFMGITLRCARCHDHKFEPFSIKDYYKLLAVFTPLQRPGENADVHVGTPAELKVYRDGMAKCDAEVAEVENEYFPKILPIQERFFKTGKSGFAEVIINAFRTSPEKRNPHQKNLVRDKQAELNTKLKADATSEEKTLIDERERKLAMINAARPTEPPRAYIWTEPNSAPPDTFVLDRGEPKHKKEKVEIGLPTVLTYKTPTPPKSAEASSGRRMWLARWLTSPENPLTARVMVNRVWQHHFGKGLVASSNDFGVIGSHPSHLELLDWLALQFQNKNGLNWSMKRLHKMMLLSNTYRAASTPAPDALKLDPDNKLLSRWRMRRMEAEVVRDSVLAVSGQLNPAMYGASVYPKLPESVLQGQSAPGSGWGKSDPKDVNRRSIYIFSKRSLAVPELEALDIPMSADSCECRTVSTVAPQALTFMNGEFMREQAKHFAQRLLNEAGKEPSVQIQKSYSLAFARVPTAQEKKAGLEFLAKMTKQIETDMRVAKQDTIATAGQKALEAYCLMLLNSNEFFYTE